jgi:hypothetical protein
MDNQESRKELITIGGMGLLVGLSLMVAGIIAGRQLHTIWNIWPSTDGAVVRGAVQEVLQVPYAKGGLPVRRFTPKVVFRYRVSGRDYTTEAPSVYTADTYEKAAANLSRMYAPGTHHPIRYNPRDPGEIEFGVIQFGPLAFSFLLLVGGAVLSAMGLKSLAKAYSRPAEVAPAREAGIPATVLPFPDRAQQELPAATLRCPACGRPVKVTEETCPNCLKFLRAA